MKQEYLYEVKNLLRDVITDVHTVVPGKIVYFDPDKCEAEVELLAHFRKPDGSFLKFPNIHEVPVMFPQAAGQTVTITWLIQPGDYVSVYFMEQPLDTWRTGAEPTTDLRFDLSNAFCVPGFFAKPNPLVKRAYDNQSIIIQRKNSFVELFDRKIGVKTDGDIIVEAAANITITANANMDIRSNGPMTITSDTSIKMTAPRIDLN